MKLYEGYKVYGPYLRKDNRLVVILRKNLKNKTVSYPKYIMELKIGRYLNRDEEVHHIDENPLNNDFSNLEIKNATKHRQDHFTIYTHPIRVQCVQCDIVFEMSPKQQSEWNKNTSRRKRKIKVGPFCSKKCVGTYGQIKQIEQRK